LGEIGTARLEYWMNQIRAIGSSTSLSPVIMVGTHQDAKECTPTYVEDTVMELSIRYPKRRFNGLEGICTVSCKKGTGVKELKQRLVDLASSMPIIVPITWLRLKEHIEHLELPYIPWSMWRALALDCGVHESELLPCIELFNNTGLLLYFNDEQAGLADLVILDSNWLSDVMASMIGFRSTWLKDGVMDHRNIDHIWKEYPPRLQEQILALLLKFDVIYPMKPPPLDSSPNVDLPAYDSAVASATCSPSPEPSTTVLTTTTTTTTNTDDDDNNTDDSAQVTYRRRNTRPASRRPDTPLEGLRESNYLVPSLLSPDRPEAIIAQHWWSVAERSERGRVFKFAFMPLGFFERVMVRVLHIPDIELFAMWNTGLLAHHRGENALLTYDPKIYHFSIRVRSLCSDPLQLLSTLVGLVELLLECYYPKLKDSTTRWLNCTHCTMHGIQTPYQFRFEECVAAITSASPFVYCHGIRTRAVRVDQLAPDIAFSSFPNIDASHLEMHDLLGQGGCGEVYLATLGDTQVAVKRLIIDSRLNDISKQANKFLDFQREANIMRYDTH
jgi:hypothetical protein